MGFIEDFYNNPALYFTHTELMEQKAMNALNYAFTGYGKTFDEAMEIVKDEDTTNLSPKEIEERDMLVGLVDNLVFFSVAQEHQALIEMAEDAKEADSLDEFKTMAIGTFAKYNKTYANIENGDILFALGLAAEWHNFETNEIIGFHTQGDERVRVSHSLLNGLRYRKSQFPPALMPPIAHGCRCYLVSTGSTDGRKLTNKQNADELIDSAVDPTFKGNVAVSGTMFSDEHPYFTIKSNYSKALGISVKKIKTRLGL